MMKQFVCIICPNSCRLQVEDKNGEIIITGNKCKRGAEHGRQEYTNPKRTLTSTVIVEEGILPRLPVISIGEVPKEKLHDCLAKLYEISVTAPVQCGHVIIHNICDTGVDIIASRSMKRKKDR